MRWRYVFKVLVRSRSLRFTIKAARKQPSAKLDRLRWCGRDVFYRPGTSDVVVLYQNLLRTRTKAEYYVPRSLRPKVILDIGSNIGGSILYFHRLFPEAAIIGFEPHPETFDVLRRNVADLPAVSVFNYGLSAADATITVPFEGVRFGGFCLAPDPGADPTPVSSVDCEVRHAGNTLRDLGVSEVDLMKIDCEGSELNVFTALPQQLIARCKWIVGEMHDASAFQILALLAPHFDLDLRKQMFKPCFRFHACNLAEAEKLKRQVDVRALQR